MNGIWSAGLTLKTGDIVKAAKAWPAALFGVVGICTWQSSVFLKYKSAYVWACVQRDFQNNNVAKKYNFLSVECYLYTPGSRIYWLFLYKFVYVINSGVNSIHHTISCNPSLATTIISSRACHRYAHRHI